MRFVLFAGAALLALPAHAQLGVRAGGNLAYLREIFSRDVFPSSTIPRVGYHVGVYYEQALGKHWQLVPEVAFSRESQQLRKEGVGYSTYYIPDGSYLIHDYRATFSYLTVPLLLRRRIGPAYVEVGPQGSVLVGGRGVGETRHIQSLNSYYTTFSVTREPIDQRATAYYRRLEAGVCLGAGVRLPAGWGAGVRAYWGMSALTFDPNGYPYAEGVLPPAGSQYRRTAQVSLTYQRVAKK